MSNSLHENIIRFDSSVHGAADAPLDTMTAVEILQNLAHLRDSAGQVLIASPGVAAGRGLVRELPPSTSGPSVIAQFGPFPLMMRPDGKSYAIRIRMAGRVTVGGTTARVSMMVHAPGADPLVMHDSATDTRVQTHLVNDTSVAWRDTESGETVLQVPADLMVNHIRDVSTRQSIGGAEDSVLIHVCVISLTGVIIAGTGDFELSGLYAAEFVGI